jgi:predicted secreted protein
MHRIRRKLYQFHDFAGTSWAGCQAKFILIPLVVATVAENNDAATAGVQAAAPSGLI